MKTFQLLFLIVTITYSQRSCSLYDGNELGCFYYSPAQCRWSSISNSCQDVTSLNLGCNSQLNTNACQVQQFIGDLTRAFCIFDTQCSTAQYLNYYPCYSSVSSAACQAISTAGQYCYWDSLETQCKTFQDCSAQTTQYSCEAQDYSQCMWVNEQCKLTTSCSNYQDESSCANDFMCFWDATEFVHSVDVYVYVYDYYIQNIASPTKKNIITDIEDNLLFNFGCYVLDELRIPIILPNLQCDSRGLNEKGCQLISKIGEKCNQINKYLIGFWQDNQCIRVNALSEQEQLPFYYRQDCKGSLNKYACLSIRYTQNGDGCYWNGECQGISKGNLDYQDCSSISIIDDIKKQVSPSICLLSNSVCYFNQKTFDCVPMCRDQSILNDKSKCLLSTYDCTYGLVDIQTSAIECHFKSGGMSTLCGYLGQNEIECMMVKETCQFKKGICLPITKQQLGYLNCEDNLNKLACTRLTNPSQTCIWDDITQKCQFYAVNKDSCVEFGRIVNANFCTFITNEPCIYDSINLMCQASNLLTGQCLTDGVNKQTCLGISKLGQYCQWNKDSAYCINLESSSNTDCQSLTQVNAQSCQRISSSSNYCMYSQSKYSCIELTQTDGLKCDSPGISLYTCMNIKNQACRWSNGHCVTVLASQGSSISCNSLQGVSYKTCAIVTLGREECKFVEYDKVRGVSARCTTSIKSDNDCNTPGLNAYGCASRKYDCYFNSDNYQCQIAIPDPQSNTYNNLFCSSSFPSKSVCIKITQTGQFCKWSLQKKQCQDVTFTLTNTCEGFVNDLYNPNTCVGLQGDAAGNIQSKQMCYFDGSSCKEAQTYFSNLKKPITQFPDCGGNYKVNMHACAYFSNPNQKCYFDTSKYQCVSLTDSTLLNTLQCKQANKATCVKITTPNQLCVWSTTTIQCYSTDVRSTKSCDDDFAAGDNLYGQNVCAQVTNSQACEYDSTNYQCILTTVTNRKCSYPGLNKLSCLTKTSSTEACYYDGTRNMCVDLFTDDAAFTITDCSKADVNKGGCLAIKGTACEWLNNKCVPVTMTGNENCATFNSKLINPYVCANITNNKCIYDSTNHICKTTTSISDCYFGYSSDACSLNTNCIFDPLTLMCKTSQQTGQCSNLKTQVDCIGTTMDTCLWYQSQCVKVDVTPSSKCSDFVKGTYNPLTCQKVTLSGQYCQYSGGVCVDVTTTTLSCDDAGLNQAACMLKTDTTQACYFDKNQCSVVSNIKTIGCDSKLSQYGCSWASKPNNYCKYDQTQNLCIEATTDVSTAHCADYTDNDNVIFNRLICQSINNEACQYGTVTCAAVTGYAADCTEAQSNYFNAYACTHNTAKPCTYDNNLMECQDMKQTDILTCQSSTTYGQCISVTKTNEICQWDGTHCNTVANVLNDCTTSIEDVNINYCMAIGGAGKCGWQRNPTTNKGECYTVTDSSTDCYGLNLNACKDTAQTKACYFKSSTKQCLEVTGNAVYDVQCNDPVTKWGCLASEFGQACKWENDQCSEITIGVNDICTTYNQKLVNPPTCSKVKGNSPDSECYYDATNYKCVKSTSDTNDCSTTGLSEFSCMTQTKGYQCLFNSQNFKCITISKTDQAYKNYKCSDRLSYEACINFDVDGQSCKWDISNHQCILVTVQGTDTCTTYAKTDSYEYGPQTCSQITGEFCLHTGNGCDSTIPDDVTCSTIGLNKKACVEMTTDNCVFTGSTCQTATTSQACTDYMNENACVSQTTNCCQWDPTTFTCSSGSVAPTDTCSSLTNKSSKCCTQVTKDGEACYFDSNSCQSAQPTTKSTCSSGNNQLGCTGYTSGFCKWNLNACTEILQQNQINMVCSDNLNKAACLSVDKNKGQCQYDDTTKTCSQITVGPTTKCAQLTLISDSDFCSQVQGETCKYDRQSSSCVSVDVTRDGSDTTGLNQYGCLLIYAPGVWNTNNKQCEAPQGQMTSCDATYNRGACTKVDVTRVTCKYSTSCSTFLFDASTTVCSDITFTNNPTLCSLVAKNKEPCYYDQSSLSCSVLTYTSPVTQCSNALDQTPDSLHPNEWACRRIHQGYQQKFYQCKWQGNQCVDSTVSITSCEDYTGYYQCLEDVELFCHWDLVTETCTSVVGYSDTVQINCADFPKLVSRKVCFFYAKDNCNWDSTAYNCIVPPLLTSCGTAYSTSACMGITDNDCFFNQDSSVLKCQEILPDDFDVYTCLQLKYSSRQGYDNICLKNVREGEFCQLQSGYCSTANLILDICEDYMSILSCEMIKTPGRKCKWLDNQCVSANVNNSSCTETLNALACVNVRFQGQKCQWLGQTCISFQGKNINGNTYYVKTTDNELLVSPYVCQIVYDPNDIDTTPMKWDPQYYRCIQFDPQTDQSVNCETLGLNKYGCLSLLNYRCGWNNDYKSCYTIEIKDDNTYCSQYINVGPNVCQQSQLSCKYNSFTSSCVAAGQNELCSTQGLSRSACESNTLCMWQINQCILQTKFVPESCSLYQLVTPMVCASLDIYDLSCAYNTSSFSCYSVDSTEMDQCETVGANKQACLNFEYSPCKWDPVLMRCSTQEILQGVTSCQPWNDNHVAQYSNAVSCSQISFGYETCKYDPINMGCTSDQSDGDECTTIGLNRVSCASINKDGQKCIYDNGVCRDLTKYDYELVYSCESLSNVNANACRMYEDLLNPSSTQCKYSLIQMTCVSISKSDTCDSIGVNHAGCNYIANSSNCLWDSEFTNCVCNSGFNQLINCNASSTSQACQSQNECLWEQPGQCRRKLCGDIDPKNCKGTIINGFTCYLTDQSICLDAQTCDQISDLNPVYKNGCDEFTFNSENCRQDVFYSNRCTAESCYTLDKASCSKGLPGQTCIFDDYYDVCRFKNCQDITTANDCKGAIVNKATCLYDDTSQSCIAISTCESIDSMQFENETQQSSTCNSLKINGMQCNWKTISQFSSTKTCTSNQCNNIGSSDITCSGAEVDSSVCVFKGQICLTCESITDSCICQKYNQYCVLKDGQCSSNTCSSAKTETDCLSSVYQSRCSWLSNSQSCVVKCIKLSQDQCKERSSSTQSCYWDSNLKYCADGQVKTIILDPLSVINNLTVQYIWGSLLSSFVFTIVFLI